MRLTAAATPLLLQVSWLVIFASLLVHSATSPMPYRPGYGLGSWIPPQVIAGMKKEAYARSAILLSEQMDSAAESLARELKMATAPLRNPMDDSQDIPPPLTDTRAESMMREITAARKRAWGARVGAYDNLLTQMEMQASELQRAALDEASATTTSAVEAFATFGAAVESPVDWGASKLVLSERAFDSFSVGTRQISADLVTRNKDSTSGSHMSGGASSFMFGFSKFGIMSGSANANTVRDVLENAYGTRNIEQTLVLSAFATHRKVQQFAALTLDHEKVRHAWNAYHPNATIHDPEMYPDQFIADFEATRARAAAGHVDPAPQTIELVTEVFRGSTIVGFVHFLKTEKSAWSAQEHADSSSRMKFFGAVAGLAGIGAGKSYNQARAKELAKMASDANIGVEFDLLCLGHIPRSRSTLVETVVRELKSVAVADKKADRDGAAGQAQQQDGVEATLAASVARANKIVRENPVLGIETFMTAFDDYAQAAKMRPDEVGAPVGLNVRPFARADVLALVSKAAFGETDEDDAD